MQGEWCRAGGAERSGAGRVDGWAGCRRLQLARGRPVRLRCFTVLGSLRGSETEDLISAAAALLSSLRAKRQRWMEEGRKGGKERQGRRKRESKREEEQAGECVCLSLCLGVDMWVCVLVRELK